MTKECQVILNNEVVTVVKYDKTEVQFPSVHKEVKTLFVDNDNGKYTIVNKLEAKEPAYKKIHKKEIEENTVSEDLKETEHENISDAE